ncbi:MAG: metallophosphoesterase family protein [Thermodesulfobacteriota bacterium]
MKIGVLSDTHLRSPDKTLDHILDKLFADADMILHAGDIVTARVLERLEERGVLAVCGNMDDYEVAGAIPQTRIIDFAGLRIGLIHGWGARQGLEERIVARFDNPKPDLIVYGHTHVPFWGKVNGTQMFNPGTAASRGFGAAGTVGVLEIDDDRIEPLIVPVERQ